MEKATRQHTRDHNARLVFKTLYDAGALSRADLARATGLTRPTVSTIVTGLIDEGLVVEAGTGPSVGGKPPTMLGVPEAGRHLLCLDLSGANFRGAVIDLRGEIHHREAVPVAGARGTAALALVVDLIDRLEQAAAAPLLGIGVATPGLVDPGEGVVRRAVNLGWSDVALARILEERSSLPVHIANDSKAAALAEYMFGPPRESANLITIRVGQGIGAGIVLNGQLFYGDGFGAGEIGHVVVQEDGRVCSCGNRGCLETTSSTRAILANASKLEGWTSSDVSWDWLAERVTAQDMAAVNLVQTAGRYLGVAAAGLVGGFNIHEIALSGRVVALGDLFLEAVRSEMGRRVLPAMVEATTISYSTLGGDIVLLGASALLLQQELGII